MELDPLVVRRGQGAGPGDLIDQYRLRGAGSRRWGWGQTEGCGWRGGEERVRVAWCAGDRVALSVMSNTSVAGEGPPITGDVSSTISFHTGTRGGITPGPNTTSQIGAVHHCSRRILEPQCLTAVLQCAGVDPVSGDVGDRGVVGPLEQVEAVGGNRAGEGDVDIAFIGEGPSVEVDRVWLLVVEFDPLIVR